MEFSIALTIDQTAQNKFTLANGFINDIQNFINKNEYGKGIRSFLIGLQCVNPPPGFEQIHKLYKPKFTENKVLTNKYTGQKTEIRKQFYYNIKITGSEYHKFVNASDEESKKMLAEAILKSLSNLDFLPKRIEFDREKFRTDLEGFVRQHLF